MHEYKKMRWRTKGRDFSNIVAWKPSSDVIESSLPPATIDNLWDCYDVSFLEAKLQQTNQRRTTWNNSRTV